MKAVECATGFAEVVASAVESSGLDKGKHLLSDADVQAHVCKQASVAVRCLDSWLYKGKICSAMLPAFKTYKACLDVLGDCVDSALRAHLEKSKEQMAAYGCEGFGAHNSAATQGVPLFGIFLIAALAMQ